MLTRVLGESTQLTLNSTEPLQWLCMMPKLQSLVIHVAESQTSEARNTKTPRRRPQESAHVRDLMRRATSGKCNNRLNRNLRCLQGIDYVYQLRGMQYIQLYNVELEWRGT